MFCYNWWTRLVRSRRETLSYILISIHQYFKWNSWLLIDERRGLEDVYQRLCVASWKCTALFHRNVALPQKRPQCVILSRTEMLVHTASEFAHPGSFIVTDKWTPGSDFDQRKFEKLERGAWTPVIPGRAKDSFLRSSSPFFKTHWS